MMTVAEAILRRRSIRHFKPDPVPGEVVLKLLEAARLAPSGHNRQPWRFLAVTDPAGRRKLREIAGGQRHIEEAPLVMVCCGDFNAYTKAATLERLDEFVKYGVVETFSGEVADQSRWEEQAEKTEKDRAFCTIHAIANTHIAICQMLLMATALGLGTCWIQAMHRGEPTRAYFHLPDNIIVVAFVAIGYAAKVPPPRPRLPLSQLLLQPLPPFAREAIAAAESKL